ncbi:hypothetical protein RND71_033951 [Anisodus tanguticus]|uniref:leucine--tRNA ligase n=1 Tax=Anisodus tanguticus TaxID=243964 RepID=A0AAE1RBT3_9SOLA|nr:hypothetical protein RND71_033951 [Anisodus tanguticus]
MRICNRGLKFALVLYYPCSGAGLHVGHPLGYTATDILARFKRMQGFNVLHPMGWDAFGLPAEQYAIEFKSIGFSYDWDREISTTEHDYYKWTRWIFLQLLKRGLAYQAEVPVNWCPALGTVLANEEVIDGVSERGGHPVIRKPMRQWMLKITAYADRLLEDLDDLDWPESIKEMQRNWIGRSEGAEMDFVVINGNSQEEEKRITVYTTRPDTIFGATYLVLAPEHPLLSSLLSQAQSKHVEEYRELSFKKSDLERTELQKEKSGVFTGCYAKNPVNGQATPIWVADYVLGSYGTGAIIAVPAHDTRDFEFAMKYSIPITWVVRPDDGSCGNFERPYSGEGSMINSSCSESGLDINGAASRVIQWLEKSVKGKKKVNYKLRDWLFARQRYWGEPISVIFLDDTGEGIPVPETELPLTLPELDDFTPTGTGEPPLSKAVITKDPLSGKPARREANTIPQWAGSCWYYLRFMDPKNSSALVDTAKEQYWGPVDVYVGGAERAVLHLLYARFWHKVLYDIGVVSTKEPFKSVINQGIILGEVQYTACKDDEGNLISADSVDELAECKQERIPEEKVMKSGDLFVLKDNPNIRLIARAHKMSKSRGNVVNPDDVVLEYGADSLRLYEMFMGPLSGIEGIHRFLARSWRLVVGSASSTGSYPDGTVAVDEEPSIEQLRSLHRCIEKVVLLVIGYGWHVTEEIEGTRFNTGISAMMEFINAAYKTSLGKWAVWCTGLCYAAGGPGKGGATLVHFTVIFLPYINARGYFRWDKLPRSIIEAFVLLLSPYAPHMAEELWSRLGHSNSLAYEPFPKADAAYLKESTAILPVQINGKTRCTIQVEETCTEEEAVRLASLDTKLSMFLDGKFIRKRIYVQGNILSIVIDVPKKAKVAQQ